MKQVYDIRDQMPKFAANFFDPYVHQDYPKMMTHRDGGKLKPYLDASKNAVIVHSKEEEDAFLASKTSVPTVELPKAIEIPAIQAVAPQRHQFEALTPAQAEKAVANNETVAPKRRGRPPRLPADLK